MNKTIIALFFSASLLFACGGTSQQDHSSGDSAKLEISPDQLSIKIDPVCQMSMEQHPIADTATYKGKLYGFCSTGCKEAFKAEPEKFLSELK